MVLFDRSHPCGLRFFGVIFRVFHVFRGLSSYAQEMNNMQRVSLKRVCREKELWLLVLLGMLYFYRPLFLRETFFFRDLCLRFLPQKQLLANFMQARELPLWDPYLHGGQPYLASIGNSALYPSNLLYAFLPLLTAFNFNIVLHIIGCAAFAYLFARIMGLQPVSSMIAGSIYAFCGYTLSLINLGVLLLTMPYVPLLFLFWHLYLLEGRRRWFFCAVIIGVMQAFAGISEINLLSLLALAGWSLCYPYPQTPLRKLLRWGILVVLIVGIAAVQILPTVEMMLQASRGQGFDYAAFSHWSLAPARLPELILPGFLGDPTKIPWSVHYWGWDLEGGRTPYICSIYFGGVALLLALLGGLDKDAGSVLPFRARLFLLALFGLALLFALGRFMPAFRLLYQYVPFITSFRYPIKFLVAGIFPLALLAGDTANRHFGLRPGALQAKPSARLMIMLWGLAALALLVTGLFGFSDAFAILMQKFFFHRADAAVMRPGITAALLHAAVVWLAVTLLYQARRLRWQAWQAWLLAGLLWADLLSAGAPINPYAPRAFFTAEPPIIAQVRREIGDGKLFRAANPPELTLQVPSADVLWLYRSAFGTLDFYVGAFYHFPVIFHEDFDKLAQIRLMRLKALLESLPWERRLPLLAASGVTVIVAAERLALPGLRLAAEIPNRTNVPFYLYRNERALARTTFVASWEVVNSDIAAAKAMLRPDYDPRKHVILRMPGQVPGISEVPGTFATDVQVPGTSDVPGTVIEKLTANTHAAAFAVSTVRDGYLVFTEPFYPGWRASVDGKPTTILRANYAFSAIFLPAGKHEVQRWYRPNSLLLGILGSLGFCVLLGVTLKLIRR